MKSKSLRRFGVCPEAQMLQTERLQIVGFLVVVAARQPLLISFGLVVPIIGASRLAFWVTSRGRSA